MGATMINPATLQAVSDAHTIGQNEIVSRVKAVAIAASESVKMSDLAKALKVGSMAAGSTLTPVSQQTLGRSTGVLAVLDRAGLTLDAVLATVDGAKLIASTHDAIQRHGKSVIPELVDAAIKGKTTAAKMGNLSSAAESSVKSAQSERAAKKRATTEKIDADKTPTVDVIKAVTVAIMQDRLKVTPELSAAIAALVEVHAAKMPRTVPAPVKAPTKAKA